MFIYFCFFLFENSWAEKRIWAGLPTIKFVLLFERNVWMFKIVKLILKNENWDLRRCFARSGLRPHNLLRLFYLFLCVFCDFIEKIDEKTLFKTFKQLFKIKLWVFKILIDDKTYKKQAYYVFKQAWFLGLKTAKFK